MTRTCVIIAGAVSLPHSRRVWGALTEEWQALPEIARRAHLTEREATVVLDVFLRREEIERKLDTIIVRPPKPKRKGRMRAPKPYYVTSMFYRRRA